MSEFTHLLYLFILEEYGTDTSTGEWIHALTLFLFILKEYGTDTPTGEWIHALTLFILKEYDTTKPINPLLSD